ncbi:protein FAM83G isoform X2 [Elgaria multicarinata webbii]|uniref:protein FAM83G isoform X2 n=1 Tax=Elgaria multicarinata webbii TaxID=159646 RepID=UPI002FCCE27A
MAFSQVQCLDDSHVNWRSSESKPEFFYSEEQRLALEALVSKGPDAFYEVLKKENIRDFLSELELKRILDTLETYDPGSEFIPRGDTQVDFNAQNGEQGPAPSSDYWPERSDRSIPQLDLGWPETIAYRGVTRATVYMQPPIDYQPHIKEVVRKMIFQAQKVVGVVMDMFTDVDIFKDLLDAGFKRKVAIYIILDETNLKYFLQMCERTQMHAGHLKNLRVRTMGGTEFFTRSATRFKGALAQKFMFVDGDKAMSGSYSFTWSAARTDRNVISVLSGQVVETFDKQFQELYLLSRGVSLKSIPMDEEPEPEPMILPSIMPVSTANAVVKKIVNPKYALVKAKSADQISNSEPSSVKNVTEQQKVDVKSKAIPEGRVSERPSDLLDMTPPIHPGLQNLEKANMFDYLPTWVEPDPEPGSEILGYINIIDPKIKNIQLSQMNRIKVCDVSQASAQHRLMLKQKSQEAKKGHHGKPAAPTSPHQPDAASAPGPTQQAPAPNAAAASPTEKTHGETADGETFATLANNQHLKQLLDPQTHDQTDAKGTTPPVPKPRTVHVTDLIATKTTQAQEGASPAEDAQTQQSGTSGTSARHNEGTGQVPDTGRPCKLSRQVAVCQEAVNGLPVAEAEEAEEEDYITLSDHGSLSGGSGGHSRRYSDASSVSDEYFEVRDRSGPLRRTNSDFLPNGGGAHSPQHRPPLQRKLSEPHMSRGTFVSPLGSPQALLSPGLEEASQRRRHSDSMEESRAHNCSAMEPGCKCPPEEEKAAPDRGKLRKTANTSGMDSGQNVSPQAQPASPTGRAKPSAPARTRSPVASPKAEIHQEQPATRCPHSKKARGPRKS